MKKHTSHSQETYENLKQHILGKGGHFYAKKAGSSEGAVWEFHECTGTLRLTDLTHTNPFDYALFEFYPGIMVRDSRNNENTIDNSCYKNVAAYCAEFIKPGFGVMEVSRDHRDIYFKCELPIRENALSVSTIESIEKRALEVITQHRDNLTFLANTYVPYKIFRKFIQQNEQFHNETENGKTSAPEISQFFYASLDSIRNHLEKHSNHNTVAESVDESGNPTWKCEIFTGRDHYFLDLCADQQTGMLIMKAMDGPKNFPIDVDSRREVAAYMAETSSIRKVGYLWCGDDNEGMCCVTNASLVDGVIGSDTIELMEGLLIKSLDDARVKAYALAYGEEMEASEKESGLPRLDMLRKMLGKEDEDDDESADDDEPKLPFDGRRPFDFSGMMADVLSRVKRSHKDQEADDSEASADTIDDLFEPDDEDNDDNNVCMSNAELSTTFTADHPRISGD